MPQPFKPIGNPFVETTHDTLPPLVGDIGPAGNEPLSSVATSARGRPAASSRRAASRPPGRVKPAATAAPQLDDELDMTPVQPKSDETPTELAGLELSEMEIVLQIKHLGFDVAEWFVVHQRIASFDHRNRPIYEPESTPVGWYLTMLDRDGRCLYAGRQAEWTVHGPQWVTPIGSLRDCLSVAKAERQRLNADEEFEAYRQAETRASEERARRLLREVLEA
jgi:hypothetical protein